MLIFFVSVDERYAAGDWRSAAKDSAAITSRVLQGNVTVQRVGWLGLNNSLLARWDDISLSGHCQAEVGRYPRFLLTVL